MLKGKELGAAIDAAIRLKLESGAVRSKAEIARHFNMKPPSLVDWVKKGSVAKEKINDLWKFFSDVAGPEHWGLTVDEWPAGLAVGAGESKGDEPPPVPTYVEAWPFPKLSRSKLDQLGIDDVQRLEGALALAAAQLGMDVFEGRELSGRPLLREVREAEAANDGDYVEVNQYDVKFAAGLGTLAFEANPRNKLAFRRSFLRSERVKHANAIVVYAKGDSMEPVIPDGAALLIDRAVRELSDGNNGRIFGFRLEGELLVKKLEKLDDGSICAHSINPAYKAIHLDRSTDFEIIGRVVWMGARL